MPKILKNILRMTLFLLILGTEDVYGQDPEFTQFYSAPMNLNPALIGSGRCQRAIFNYRNQWNGAADRLGAAYESYMAAWDGHFKQWKSGFGFAAMVDNSGGVPVAEVGNPNSTNSNIDGTRTGVTSLLSLYNFVGGYSYRISGLPEDFKIQIGIEGVFIKPQLRTDRLIFADQIDPLNGLTDNATSEQINSSTSSVFTANAGITIFNPQFYVGFAMKNLTEPSPSINFVNGSSEILMYRRMTIHGGTLIQLSDRYKRETYIGPEFLYTQQGPAKQLNIGVYWTGKMAGFPVNTGAWVRHTTTNLDAIVPYYGITIDKIKMSISYDITLSSLSVTRSAGTPEVAFTYNFCGKYSPPVGNCPRFN